MAKVQDERRSGEAVRRCPLCKADRITRRYELPEDMAEWAWAASCATCGLPMVVLKEHRARFTDEERAKILLWVGKRFGRHPEAVRFLTWSLPGHAHCHVHVSVEALDCWADRHKVTRDFARRGRDL